MDYCAICSDRAIVEGDIGYCEMNGFWIASRQQNDMLPTVLYLVFSAPYLLSPLHPPCPLSFP